MIMNKNRLYLGIGFWMGMGVMSLINFFGEWFGPRIYNEMRYSFVMFFISIILLVIGILYWKHIQKT